MRRIVTETWYQQRVRRRHRIAAGIAAVSLACAVAGCDGSSGGLNRPVPTSSSTSRTSSTPPTRPPASTHPTGRELQLPRGGRQILGHYRVVAYYGAPGSGALGILGAGSPEQAARSLIQRAKGFDGYGLPVQPAMELIATVAQASPGPDGDYSTPIPIAQIRRYLAVAHRFKMLLILDLQPGRASFLSQAKALKSVLLDPSVGLGLDPEWKVDNGAPGGGRIGSTDAASVNAVTDWLSALVQAHHLPDKLEIVHEFTLRMLRDRDAIRPRPGVQIVFHADGFGSRAVKRHVYAQLHFPGRPFGTGFKLFLTQDTRMMRPAQVMRLRPRPDVITYQ